MSSITGRVGPQKFEMCPDWGANLFYILGTFVLLSQFRSKGLSKDPSKAPGRHGTRDVYSGPGLGAIPSRLDWRTMEKREQPVTRSVAARRAGREPHYEMAPYAVRGGASLFDSSGAL